jgi:hypothetical protein
MGILAHKKYIKKIETENNSLTQRLIEQTKKTIKAHNDLLILQEQTKKFKRN